MIIRARCPAAWAGTVTDPWFAGQRLGCEMAWWVLDQAAQAGRAWVRRGTIVPALVRYFRDVQGWQVVREQQTSGLTVVSMSRPAARVPDRKIGPIAVTIATRGCGPGVERP